MIAYEDLVVALKSWRARNGLPDTPADFGGPAPAYTVAPQSAAPDEVYDLSDDSGLIVADDLVAAQAADEYPDDYAEPPYDDDQSAYDEPPLGAIETGVEVSGESAMPVPDDYDNPPSTDAYSDYSPAELDPYRASASDAYAEPTSDAYGDPAYDEPDYGQPPPLAEPAPLAEPEYGAADAYGQPDEGATVIGGDEYMPPAEGTLEADAADVVDEVSIDQEDDGFEEVGAEGILDEEMVAYSTVDDAPDEATVVAEAHVPAAEPDALPEPPDDPDRDY